MACFYSWLMLAQLSQKKETDDVDRMLLCMCIFLVPPRQVNKRNSSLNMSSAHTERKDPTARLPSQLKPTKACETCAREKD
jgi:hypothetical protein